MTGEPWRYLRWWATEHKWSRLLFTGPFLIIAGPTVIGASVAASDFKGLFMGGVLLLAGLIIVFSDVFHYRAKSRPETRTAEPGEPGP